MVEAAAIEPAPDPRNQLQLLVFSDYEMFLQGSSSHRFKPGPRIDDLAIWRDTDARRRI
jgi:hypothetical protein